jgi:hypothetical protein
MDDQGNKVIVCDNGTGVSIETFCTLIFLPTYPMIAKKPVLFHCTGLLFLLPSWTRTWWCFWVFLRVFILELRFMID